MGGNSLDYRRNEQNLTDTIELFILNVLTGTSVRLEYVNIQ